MQQRATRAQTNLNNMSIRPTTWSVHVKNKGWSFCLALSDKSKNNANKFELLTLSQQSRAIPSIVWWKHSRRKDQSDCHALWKLGKRGVIIESLVDHLMDLHSTDCQAKPSFQRNLLPVCCVPNPEGANPLRVLRTDIEPWKRFHVGRLQRP